MSKIIYTLDFIRIATYKTPKGLIPVGLVTEYKQFEDGSIKCTVEFNPQLPKELREALEKKPHLMGIQTRPKESKDIIILPE